MDQTGIAFLDIVFFAMVAGFLILRLRSVLGRRTGEEKPERWRPRSAQQPLPGAARKAEGETDNVTRFPERPEATAPGGGDNASSDTPMAAGLASIRAADPNFAEAEFARGARAAFEMIVAAFAQADTATLKPLLAADVYDNFAAAIRDRQQKSQKLDTTLIGIKAADIVEAGLRDRVAFVTIKFVSEQVNVTRDAAGTVVDGDPARVDTITDVWTFTRDTRSRDPNWHLAATAEQH
jgi:predicted lipid-binding transport protein (Tim44 family)